MIKQTYAWLMATMVAIGLSGCFAGDSNKQQLAQIAHQPAHVAVIDTNNQGSVTGNPATPAVNVAPAITTGPRQRLGPRGQQSQSESLSPMQQRAP